MPHPSETPHAGNGFRILSKERLTPVTHRFVLEAPWVARAAQPGQFVIVRVVEGGERIPVTIADFDAARGTITVVVQEVGHTSKRFGALQEGGTVLDVAGPLGEPFHALTGRVVIGIGGGFGAAALYPIMRGLQQAGVATEAILGARTKDVLILEQELRSVCRDVQPCTDDGSYGFKGLVTECFTARLPQLGAREALEVVAVGPMPMMRAVAAVTAEHGIPAQVSLDPIMVDGTGMCGGCRVTVGGQIKFACVDGPMFDAHQVDFAELVRRNKMYKQEERLLHAG